MKRVARVVGLAALVAASPAFAFDYSLSGFATIGYATSNRPYGYQRFIDDGGTFRRDSVAGLQVDAMLTNEVGATVQIKAAPSTSSDGSYEASASWAFVSYRPSNDWLLRAGKQRIPYYLYSENIDVGATYDFVRLPTEMYSIASINDFVGISVGKTWRTGDAEIALDGYYGRSDNDYRVWSRDDIPGVQQAGPTFSRLEYSNAAGLTAAYRRDDLTLRAALLRGSVKVRGGGSLPTSFPFVAIAPGIGYYQVSDQLPGPGVPMRESIVSTLFSVGMEAALPADFRFVGEYAHSVGQHSDIGPQGNRGYAAVLRPIGKWTPYVTYAFLRSPARQRALYGAINDNTVPAFLPGAASSNASQRAAADQVMVYDQSSFALGTSYSFSAKSKLKAEVLRTRIRDGSQLIDPLPGTTVRHDSVNVYSLSYSVVF